MTKEQIIAAFDPNAASSINAGLFGLPFTAHHSDIIIIPVAWEATVSFGSGTSDGPASIRQASTQIDLHHHTYPNAWKRGFYLDEFPVEMIELARSAKADAQIVIECIQKHTVLSAGSEPERALGRANAACEVLNAWVKERCSYWKGMGKYVGLLGGDHSIPMGYLQLHAEHYDTFGILHIDAHHDLRIAYEDFTFSHASIFYNALETLPAITKLVQVGIRDYCDQEHGYVLANPGRIDVFYERDMRKRLYQGENWHNVCRDIIACLPPHVHVSIDIDGLDPKLCPNTGTPVPGGLEYEELLYLLNELHHSGRNLIGFDLCEVAPGHDGWDANVAARVLYHMCALAAGQPNW